MKAHYFGHSHGRREFVRNFFVIGTGAALTQYTDKALPLTQPDLGAQTAPIPCSTGYRLTQHIERYYNSLRN